MVHAMECGGILMFQSTPSGGKATNRNSRRKPLTDGFQSTPSGGKATPRRTDTDRSQSRVSIHAFRGEGDGTRPRSLSTRGRFNPRLPGGRRPAGWCATGGWFTFQSTPSGGKATRFHPDKLALRVVSIHAFRGEGDSPALSAPRRRDRFNPRLPGGRRHYSCAICVEPDQFQSTPSGGKATPPAPAHPRFGERFNPRLPGGRRRRTSRNSSLRRRFQSTPSGGKATPNSSAFCLTSSFQSTPSGGKATTNLSAAKPLLAVSIHAFRGEGDSEQWLSILNAGVSIHAFRGEGDMLPLPRRNTLSSFQSTPSGGKATERPDSNLFECAVSIHAFRGEGDRNI